MKNHSFQPVSDCSAVFAKSAISEKKDLLRYLVLNRFELQTFWRYLHASWTFRVSNCILYFSRTPKLQTTFTHNTVKSQTHRREVIYRKIKQFLKCVFHSCWQDLDNRSKVSGPFRAAISLAGTSRGQGLFCYLAKSRCAQFNWVVECPNSRKHGRPALPSTKHSPWWLN